MLQEQRSAEEKTWLRGIEEERTCCSDMPSLIISIAKPRNDTLSSPFGFGSIEMLAIDVLMCV